MNADDLWESVDKCGCDPATGMHAVTCVFWPLYVAPPTSDPVSRVQAIEAAEDHADQVIFDAWRERGQ